MLPWNRIGSLVLEQNPVEKLFNTGTIIPVAAGDPGQDGEHRGGRGGGRQGLTRSPLTCLVGVKEPGLVMEYLRELIAPPAAGDA